jgi:hypothetical protein
VGFRCSFCDAFTVSASLPGAKVPYDLTGQAAHILTPAHQNGPRSAPNGTAVSALKHRNNGIWLCQPCHGPVDNNQILYTEEELRQRRDHAEELARWRHTGRVPPQGWVVIGPLFQAHKSRFSVVNLHISRMTAYAGINLPIDLGHAAVSGQLAGVGKDGATLHMPGFNADAQGDGRGRGRITVVESDLFIPTGALAHIAVKHGAIDLWVTGEARYFDRQWRFVP